MSYTGDAREAFFDDPRPDAGAADRAGLAATVTKVVDQIDRGERDAHLAETLAALKVEQGASAVDGVSAYSFLGDLNRLLRLSSAHRCTRAASAGGQEQRDREESEQAAHRFLLWSRDAARFPRYGVAAAGP